MPKYLSLLTVIISYCVINLAVAETPQAAKTIQFKAVKVPTTEAEKRTILASDEVVIGDKAHKIGFHTILRSGTALGTSVFGQLIDSNGEPLKAADGSPRISNKNDFSSLIPVGDKLFMVSHFESIPGAMYLTELDQASDTGLLTAVNTQPIDLSSINGGWVHCAGSVTPWNTHLGSEEYEPDARRHDPETGEIDDYYRAMAQYYGGDLSKPNPYDYGFAIEVKIHDEQGHYTVEKQYAMGRLGYELAYVMPDQRTVYLSDDGTNVGLYVFIADQPGDLTAGTLYAMKWQQTSAEQGGQADLIWINLGHATHAQVKAYLTEKIRFDAIFNTAEPQAESCPAAYRSINTARGHECLQVKPGMTIAASRLETRRYAAMMGATTELRKQEGVTFNPATNTLYIAISKISSGMENFMKAGVSDHHYDNGGPNDIRVSFNGCGGIYALDLAHNTYMGSAYIAKTFSGLLMGKMTQAYDPKSSLPAYPQAGPFSANKCDLENIANPDNITFIAGYDTLVIGEDTGVGHQNDAVWAYHLKQQTLTRIQTTPYGSETTSTYFYPNINGFSYLMSVVQHPYADSEHKPHHAEEAFAYTGYLGPLPALE